MGPSLDALSTVRKMTLTGEPKTKAHVKRRKKVSQLKFAFGEFYLSLILLQNYQVNCKIKKVKSVYANAVHFKIVSVISVHCFFLRFLKIYF